PHPGRREGPPGGPAERPPPAADRGGVRAAQPVRRPCQPAAADEDVRPRHGGRERVAGRVPEVLDRDAEGAQGPAVELRESRARVGAGQRRGGGRRGGGDEREGGADTDTKG